MKKASSPPLLKDDEPLLLSIVDDESLDPLENPKPIVSIRSPRNLPIPQDFSNTFVEENSHSRPSSRPHSRRPSPPSSHPIRGETRPRNQKPFDRSLEDAFQVDERVTRELNRQLLQPRHVDRYDGQTIWIGGRPAYELGTYLGGILHESNVLSFIFKSYISFFQKKTKVVLPVLCILLLES